MIGTGPTQDMASAHGHSSHQSPGVSGVMSVTSGMTGNGWGGKTSSFPHLTFLGLLCSATNSPWLTSALFCYKQHIIWKTIPTAIKKGRRWEKWAFQWEMAHQIYTLLCPRLQIISSQNLSGPEENRKSKPWIQSPNKPSAKLFFNTITVEIYKMPSCHFKW